MATNLVYRNTDSQNRVEDLGRTVAPGEPALSLAGLPVVAVTGSADYTISEEIEGVGTLSDIPAGGVGLDEQEVTLAFDGTWEFDADVFGGTLPTTGIDQGDTIYINDDGDELSAGAGDVEFGYVDYPKDYDTTRGFIPVRIGV